MALTWQTQGLFAALLLGSPLEFWSLGRLEHFPPLRFGKERNLSLRVIFAVVTRDPYLSVPTHLASFRTFFAAALFAHVGWILWVYMHGSFCLFQSFFSIFSEGTTWRGQEFQSTAVFVFAWLMSWACCFSLCLGQQFRARQDKLSGDEWYTKNQAKSVK